jgi:hypothetical protein
VGGPRASTVKETRDHPRESARVDRARAVAVRRDRRDDAHTRRIRVDAAVDAAARIAADHLGKRRVNETPTRVEGKTRMLNTLLLAAHIAVAAGLTITVGVQSAELACARSDVAHLSTVYTLRSALLSTRRLAVLTLITGGAVVAAGGRGGPWVGAAVLCMVLIGAAPVKLLRRGATVGPAGLGAVQWGVPTLTLAAAILMSQRPTSVVGATLPLGLALVLTALASWATARPRGRHTETSRHREDLRHLETIGSFSATADDGPDQSAACCVASRQCARSAPQCPHLRPGAPG